MFLVLAREIRDHIYDKLLLAPNETPPEPSERITLQLTARPWKQIPLARGTCLGLMSTCRQVYCEIIASIERHGGLSFELQLKVNRIPQGFGYEQILPRWIRFPLLMYPKSLEPRIAASATIPNSKCRKFYLTFEIQSQNRFSWWGDGGPTSLTTTLFNMLAAFLLHGPLGLHHSISADPDIRANMWDIDTLVVDAIGGGYEDPGNGQLCTVPENVVTDTQRQLYMQLRKICSSGALAGRVRVVTLSVAGDIKNEWSIDQGKKLSVKLRNEWARYGWIIEKKDLEKS
ncbi:hypothetical protein EV368DRAFT_69575 [Lentinula lateritia]|nr:hypothetical protein EV368DRAFT_69575 [Lentinula lateritia]